MKIKIKTLKRPWAHCDECLEEPVPHRVEIEIKYDHYTFWLCDKHLEEFKQKVREP